MGTDGVFAGGGGAAGAGVATGGDLDRRRRRYYGNGRGRRPRGTAELPAEAPEIALGLHEPLDVRRVPEKELTELLAAAAERPRDRLDLLRDP